MVNPSERREEEVQVTPCGQTPPQIDEGRMASQRRPEEKESLGLNLMKQRSNSGRSSACRL